MFTGMVLAIVRQESTIAIDSDVGRDVPCHHHFDHPYACRGSSEHVFVVPQLRFDRYYLAVRSQVLSNLLRSRTFGEIEQFYSHCSILHTQSKHVTSPFGFDLMLVIVFGNDFLSQLQVVNFNERTARTSAALYS